MSKDMSDMDAGTGVPVGTDTAPIEDARPIATHQALAPQLVDEDNDTVENEATGSSRHFNAAGASPRNNMDGDEVSDISDYSEHDDASRSHSQNNSHSHSHSHNRSHSSDGLEGGASGAEATADELQKQLELAGFSSHGMSGADIICGRTSSRRPSETSRTSSGVRIVGNMPRVQSDMSRNSSMRIDPENWLTRRTGSFSQLSSNLSIPPGPLRNSQAGAGGEQPLTRDNDYVAYGQSQENAFYPPMPKGRGFTSMYQDAVSRRIATSSSVYHYRSTAGRYHHNRSPSHSSQQSEDTSHVSPYYEPNGSWLRLRPQNHANFPYRSRFLQRQSQSVENYLPRQVHDRSYLQYNYAGNTSYSIVEGQEPPLPLPLPSPSPLGGNSHSDSVRKIGSVNVPELQEEPHQGHGRGLPHSHTPPPPTIEQQEEVEISVQAIGEVLNECDEHAIDEEMHTEFKPIEPQLHVATNTSLTLDSVGMTTLEGTTRDTAELPIFQDVEGADNIGHTASTSNANARNPNGNPPQHHRNSHALSASDDLQWASPDSKYERYHCRVDREQGDKAVEIPLFLFKRPHMRGFHYAWMSFFVAFFTWFALAPLLGEIQDSLKLTHEQVWMSNVFSSAGTVVCRIIAGPLCDRFGARFVMAATLVVAAVPVMCTGLVYSAVELYILRLITGVAGASFVVTQYWTSCMFTREIAGTANSLVAGWGNLGGGLTQIIMGSALFPLFKLMYSKSSDDEQEVADRAWRIVFIVPAFLSILMAVLIMKFSDDSPKGNYRKLKRLGLMPRVQAMKALREASSNVNTWLLFVHYGCCFGVEVTMTAGLALYFRDEFDLQTESAAAIASIFGWMNLFARGLGGFISDIMNVKSGMRGRLLWQGTSMVVEGAAVIAFSYTRSLAGAIGTMVLFSLFVQSTEGSTYSIIPYVCPSATGSVAGIVGAGGNVGGVIFLLLIQQYRYRIGFKIMGVVVLSSSLLSFFMVLNGHAGLLCGSDANEVMAIRRQSNENEAGDAATLEKKHHPTEQPTAQ